MFFVCRTDGGNVNGLGFKVVLTAFRFRKFNSNHSLSSSILSHLQQIKLIHVDISTMNIFVLVENVLVDHYDVMVSD